MNKENVLHTHIHAHTDFFQSEEEQSCVICKKIDVI